MNEYAITIHEGPLMAEDNAVYFTPEVTRTVEYLNQEERQNEAQTFAEFVPSNGRDKGKLHRVPWERVVKIVTL